MKKVLFASVALIGLASAAQAAEPVKLGLGGYMTQYAGYASNKDNIYGAGQNANGFDVQDDVRINFSGSTKLDNGIGVAVEVDTNGSQGKPTSRIAGTNKNGIKSFLTVTSAAGTIMAGEQDNVGALIHVSAPDVAGIGGQDGNFGNWVLIPGNFADTPQRTYAGDDRSENKLIYVTPAFHGLAAGVSYTPSVNPAQTGHTTVLSSSDSGTGLGDLWVYGLSYTNNFGGVSVKADAGSGVANVAGLNVYQGGLQVGYAGFTVGGSYLKRDVDNKPANAGNIDYRVAGKQGQSWDVGVSYATGPYAVSVSYFHGAAANTGNYTDSDSVVSLGGAYDLGPGVQLTGSVSYVDYQSGSSNQATHSNDSNYGVAAITGLSVKF